MDSPEAVFCRELGLDLESAKQLLNSNNYHRLRIIDIKNILKYYRDNPYYYSICNHVSISLTAPKAELVKLLERVMPPLRLAQSSATVPPTSTNKESIHMTPISGIGAPHMPYSAIGIGHSSFASAAMRPSAATFHPRVINTQGSPAPTNRALSAPQAASSVTPSSTLPLLALHPSHTPTNPPQQMAQAPLSFVDAIIQNPMNRAVVNELRAASFPTETIKRVLTRMYEDCADRPQDVEIDFDAMMCVMIEDLDDDGEVCALGHLMSSIPSTGGVCSTHHCEGSTMYHCEACCVYN
jgi:hypothetical protein